MDHTALRRLRRIRWRKHLPWIVILLAHAYLMRTGSVLDDPILWGPLRWSFMFTLSGVIAVVAWRTGSDHWFRVYTSSIITIGVFRSFQYLDQGAQNPLGVWLLVVGTHLLAWSKWDRA